MKRMVCIAAAILLSLSAWAEDFSGFMDTAFGSDINSLTAKLEKDGWKKEKYSLNGFSFEYYKNENYPLYQISFPNNKIICISPSVRDMLDRFVFLTLSGGAAGNESGAKNWLNAADNKKLLFYMPSFSALSVT